jgi:hypothetical protein
MFGAKSTTCPIKLFSKFVQFEKPCWEGLYGFFWGFLGPTCPIKLWFEKPERVRLYWLFFGFLGLTLSFVQGFLGLTCPIKLCLSFVQFEKPWWEVLYRLSDGFLGLTCPIKLCPINFKVPCMARLLFKV